MTCRLTRRSTAALPVVAALFAATAAAQEADLGIALGTVPDAPVLEELGGAEVDLGIYVGRKPVLLEFWATWCENCEALHPRMLEAHGLFGDRVEFFAIAVAVGQSEKRVARHLERHPVPYRTLWDGRGEAVRAFRAPATSYIVILDAGGRVAYTGLGRGQDLEAAVRAVLEEGAAD